MRRSGGCSGTPVWDWIVGFLSVTAVGVWFDSSARWLRLERFLLTCPKRYFNHIWLWSACRPNNLARCLVCSPIQVFSLKEEGVGKLYDACQNSSFAGFCTNGLSVQNWWDGASSVSVIWQTVVHLSSPSFPSRALMGWGCTKERCSPVTQKSQARITCLWNEFLDGLNHVLDQAIALWVIGTCGNMLNNVRQAHYYVYGTTAESTNSRANHVLHINRKQNVLAMEAFFSC